MARKLKADKAGQGSSGHGHNSKALTDEEHDALYNHHLTKLRAFGPKIEAKQAELKAIRDEQSNAFRALKNDLGYSRKEAQEDLDDTAPGRRVGLVTKKEEGRFRRRKAAGIPVIGYEGQGHLFDHTLPMEARDELEWESDGFLAGRRADDPTPPIECDPRHHQAWLKGYHLGQEQNALQMATAKDVLARKPGAPLQAEEPAEEPDPHEQAKKDADKLKASGWTDPTPAEAAFEEA